MARVCARSPRDAGSERVALTRPRNAWPSRRAARGEEGASDLRPTRNHPSPRAVALDPRHRFLAERREPLLRALAENAHHAHVEAHLHGLQPTSSETRRPLAYSVSSIARSRRPCGVDTSERRAAPRPRPPKRSGSERGSRASRGPRPIVGAQPFAQREMENALERRDEPAGGARLGVPVSTCQARALKVRGRGLHQRLAGLRRAARELRHVAPVALERGAREAVLKQQAVEKRSSRRAVASERASRTGSDGTLVLQQPALDAELEALVRAPMNPRRPVRADDA